MSRSDGSKQRIFSAYDAGEINWLLATPGRHANHKINSPYGTPGAMLYVKETFFVDHINYYRGPLLPREYLPDDIDRHLYYRADGECCGEVGKPLWRPSIFMPKWAARIWLRVTDVRVEGVEGIGPRQRWSVERFRALWDSLNAKRGYPWEANPWCWVVSFERVKP